MTYGRAHFAIQPVPSRGAAVSDLAELVRGDFFSG